MIYTGRITACIKLVLYSVVCFFVWAEIVPFGGFQAYAGDTALLEKGERLVRQHCTRCHVVGDLNRRRGIIQGMDEIPAGKVVRSEVPLSEMFGYATDVRSQTQGRASFSMEFLKYAEVPNNIAEQLKTA